MRQVQGITRVDISKSQKETPLLLETLLLLSQAPYLYIRFEKGIQICNISKRWIVFNVEQTYQFSKLAIKIMKTFSCKMQTQEGGIE